MKKLVFRKFIKDVFLSFFILITCLSVIVWVIQAVNYLDFVSEDGHGFKVYFLYTIFNFPKIFTKLFLISLFISLYYIIIKYEDNNELSIYWSLGITKIEFIKKILLFSILLIIIKLSLSSFISPKTQSIGKSFVRTSNIDFFPSLIKEKKFIDTLSNLTIYVNEQSKDKKKFKDILIKDQSKDEKEFQIIFANEGNIIKKNNSNYLILSNGEVFTTSNKKDFSNFKFENFEFNLSKFSTKTTVIPKIQENKSSNIIKCYLNNLNTNLKYFINEKELVCSKGSYKDIVQEIFKRFYLPLYIPLICLIACILLMNNKFKKYFNFKRILIFLFGFLTIFTSEIMIKYSGSNEIRDIFIFSSPILFFLIIYLIIFKLNYHK